MIRKLKKAATYVLAGGVALFVKQIWDPVLAPFTRPIATRLGALSLGAAMRLGIAAL